MPEADVTATLSELERKLRDLENELQASAPPSAVRSDAPSAARRAVTPVPEPAPEAPAADRSAPTPSAQAQLDDLLQFRGELERSAQQLMSEYERVLGSLQATVRGSEDPGLAAAPQSPPPIAPGAAASSPPTLPPSHGQAPQPPPAPAASTPQAPPTPWQSVPPSSSGLEDAVMDGAITVDAGPFTDITALSGFEQALGAVPGVRDVYVRGFEGDRAMIDVTLGQPVALGIELRRFSPVDFSITAADAGRLSVVIQRA